MNEDLPGFIVLLSGGAPPRVGDALWGSGFLPSVYQGVQCRSQGDPVLNVSNPGGVDRHMRRAALDTLRSLNRRSPEAFGDPETLTRISQYEMAFRMQTAVPEAMDISAEPAEIQSFMERNPAEFRFPTTSCLPGGLLERGVRFVQLFDWGWDSHGSAPSKALNVGFKEKCLDVDRPMTALLVDLKRRGLLDDTLVIWSGEFGRTPMRKNRGGVEMKYVGRDHNPNAFTLWMAGGRAGRDDLRPDRCDGIPTGREPGSLAQVSCHVVTPAGHRSPRHGLSLPRAQAKADGRRAGEGDYGRDSLT